MLSTLLAMTSGAGGLSVTDVLLDLLIILLAAKIGSEAAERVGAPAVVGEILAGILVGPSALGLIGADEVLPVFAEIGVAPQIVSESNDPQMVKSLIEIGLGIALIPRWAVAREAAAGRLRVLTLEGHRLVRDVNMIYLKRHTTAVRTFSEFCRQFKSSIGTTSNTVAAP